MSGYSPAPEHIWTLVRDGLERFARVVHPWWRPTVIRDGESYEAFKKRADAVRAKRGAS